MCRRGKKAWRERAASPPAPVSQTSRGFRTVCAGYDGRVSDGRLGANCEGDGSIVELMTLL